MRGELVETFFEALGAAFLIFAALETGLTIDDFGVVLDPAFMGGRGKSHRILGL